MMIGNTSQKVSKLLDALYSNDSRSQFKSMKQFRQLLSRKNPPINQVIDAGVVPCFIALAQQNKSPKLQWQALLALADIASSSSEHTAHLIDNGAHNILIDLLKWPLYGIKVAAILTLGNIAGDGKKLKDLLLNNNDILPNILSIICQSHFNDNKCISLLQITSWTLSNLCNLSPAPSIHALKLLIKCLRCLLKRRSEYNNLRNANKTKMYEILNNVILGFVYLTEFDEYQKEIFNEMNKNGVIEQLVKLMNYNNLSGKVRYQALRVIGNILVTESDDNVQKCLDLGILSKYYNILRTTERIHEKHEICWSISNITAGPIKHQILVLNNNLYPMLIELLKSAPYEVATEALCAISNSTKETNTNIIKHLIDFKIIDALCPFLQTYKASHKILPIDVIIILEIIVNILSYEYQEKSVRLKPFQHLRTRKDVIMNDIIYIKCVHVILNIMSYLRTNVLAISNLKKMETELISYKNESHLKWFLCAIMSSQIDKNYEKANIYYLNALTFGALTSVNQICCLMQFSLNCYYNKEYLIGIKILKYASNLARHTKGMRVTFDYDLYMMRKRELKNKWKMMRCNNCNLEWTDKERLKSCRGCNKVAYCSRKCQKIDWNKRHSVFCDSTWNMNALLQKCSPNCAYSIAMNCVDLIH